MSTPRPGKPPIQPTNEPTGGPAGGPQRPPRGSLPARVLVLARAAGAVAVILALTTGVPWLLLVTVGNPLPGEPWSWDQPLTNDALLGLLAVLAWLVWAQLTLCVVVEALAEIRFAAGRSADWMADIPGTFLGQQHLARVLIQAVVAVGIGAGSVPASAPASTPASAGIEPARTSSLSHDRFDLDAQSWSASAATGEPGNGGDGPSTPSVAASHHIDTVFVEVTKGDSLWSIAERHLGSGEQWRRIADLNTGRLMPNGERFAHGTSIEPGWRLLVPAPISRSANTTPLWRATPKDGATDDEVTVESGDTLWGLAEQEYGDGGDWARLYRANRDSIADPDLVFPGQRLHVPQPPAPARKSPNNPERPERPEPKPRIDRELRSSTEPAPRESHAPATEPDSRDTTPSLDGTGEGTDGASATPPPAADDAGVAAAPDEADVDEHLRVALVGGGGLLAAGVFAAFLARRRRQIRHRRSGRTIVPTPPALVPVEATVRSAGSAGGVAAGFLDRALRDLSTRLARNGALLPNVAAVRMGNDRLELILAGQHAQPPPDPWRTQPDMKGWSIARDASIPASDALAPYPALVAIGTSEEDGATWLIDLEAAGLLHLHGDPKTCEALARFFAAELALNVWSDHVEVTVSGFADDIAGLHAERLRHTERPDVDALIKSARHTREGAQAIGCDILGGRRDGIGGDTWMPSILIAQKDQDSDQLGDDLDRLVDELQTHPGRSGVAAVISGNQSPPSGATVLTVDQDGTIVLPWRQVRLKANQLTDTDARTLVALLQAAESAEDQDEPMPPATGTRPTDGVSDAAGALRTELTQPRAENGAPESLLPRADEEYLAAGATTSADLAALAALVPRPIPGGRAVASDDSLDRDLADWFDPDTPRPRLRLLGPVELRATGERTSEVRRRPAYFVEVAAYLATRDHGAAPEQVANAFNVQPRTIHSRVGTLRKWLGTDPATGDWYLPESTRSPSAKARGVPVYEMVGMLTDADLFKRLRTRGQTRGPDGIEDLISALSLVDGPPFDQLRPEGYGWLAETPLDHYLAAAVVDVAHIVATYALAAGDVELARSASETAIAAAPSEDKPRLDLLAAMTVQGHGGQRPGHLAAEILNRSDDGLAPPSPTSRNAEVVNRRGWLRGTTGP